VFLPGWEEGLFPNQRAMEENRLAALEEERRIGLCRTDPGAARGSAFAAGGWGAAIDLSSAAVARRWPSAGDHY
jgi:ATP-dependent DNA helicase UvrD/PcrA